MQTTVTKKDKGWEAKTIILLPGVTEKASARLRDEGPAPSQLEIVTSKGYNGGIQTRANVVHKTEYGFRCGISFGGTYAESGGDYSRNISTDRSARCTEKKVREFHESSLAYVDHVMAEVAAHYECDPLAEKVLEPA